MLTGATGHLGSALIPELLERGHRVFALQNRSTLNLKHPRLEWIKTDLFGLRKQKEVLKKCSVLIHAAGLIAIGQKNRAELIRVNVDGTQAMIDVCLKNDLRMVHVSSSTATKAQGANGRLDVNSPWCKEEDFLYGWTKAQAELCIRQAIQDRGLKAVILRPTALIGPPDLGPSRFGQMIFDLKFGRLSMVTTGGYDLLDIRDFCATLIRAMDMKKTNKTYLVGGRFCSLETLYRLLNANRKPKVISAELLFKLLPLLDLLQKIKAFPWPVNKESLKTLLDSPREIHQQETFEELGHEIRALEQTLKDLILWKEKTADHEL